MRHHAIRRLEKPLFILTVLITLTVIGQASWIEAKAWLAQRLIAQAWEHTLTMGGAHKPWPSADTWPVAKLITPDQKILYVLESTSGQALAFGPGRLSSHNDVGGTVIAGHRDTHFRFLEGVRQGQRIKLQQASGQQHTYQVVAMRVVDSRQENLQLPTSAQHLQLVSCYPFDAIDSGGPLRYVVHAEQISF